ncbi:MAG TPA: mercuric ion transporter MerT [Vicinamibacterales bacterium]|jgi:mercuric ion transport protein
MSQTEGGRSALVVGGLAAILASTCCLGPLVLLVLGVSGVWIGNLTALEPYRPLFLGGAVVALVVAYRKIFRSAVACRVGEECAVPQVRTTYKALFWAVVVLLVIAAGFPLVVPYLY